MGRISVGTNRGPPFSTAEIFDKKKNGCLIRGLDKEYARWDAARTSINWYPERPKFPYFDFVRRASKSIHHLEYFAPIILPAHISSTPFPLLQPTSHSHPQIWPRLPPSYLNSYSPNAPSPLWNASNVFFLNKSTGNTINCRHQNLKSHDSNEFFGSKMRICDRFSC